MRKLMPLVVLVALALPVGAQQYPFGDPYFPTVRPGAESSTVLPEKYSVSDAFVEPMKNPQDAYAITFRYPLMQSMSQCPILKHWKIVVTVQPELSGTRAYDACPSAGCYCAIFVPDEATALNYQLVLTRFAQGAPPLRFDRVQFRIEHP